MPWSSIAGHCDREGGRINSRHRFFKTKSSQPEFVISKKNISGHRPIDIRTNIPANKFSTFALTDWQRLFILTPGLRLKRQHQLHCLFCSFVQPTSGLVPKNNYGKAILWRHCKERPEASDWQFSNLSRLVNHRFFVPHPRCYSARRLVDRRASTAPARNATTNAGTAVTIGQTTSARRNRQYGACDATIDL